MDIWKQNGYGRGLGDNNVVETISLRVANVIEMLKW